jgi:predicted HTH transcriptional regulator
LSAFANSDGGRLLIGVRDNGSIAGTRSDEEFYMIDTAASLFCKPAIPVIVKQHITEGKTVLEVEVSKGDQKPYLSKGEDGKWKAYFRHGDQNLLANSIMLSLWHKKVWETGKQPYGLPESK